MHLDTDVLVIGGCTAGLYFAGLMAKQGYRTVVCDLSDETKLGDQYDIIHVGQEQFARFGLHEPRPGDDEYVANFTHSILRSALNKWPKNGYARVLVLRRALLMRRLAGWAREQGAEVLFNTPFKKPLFDAGGRLAGAELDQSGKTLEVRARLCADASGIPAVLRTSLPAGYGTENFVTGGRDQFYVVLRYVNLKNPERDAVEITTTWPYYKTWLAPQHKKGGAIMGIGANLSFEYAERCFRRFAAKNYLPEYEEDHIERGSTPYRRPPYSFAADGFIALGSAACISNPWSGEGVPYGWLLCSIAAGEAASAMKNGAYPTREALWKVNVRYVREQGALFARNLAMLAGAVRCTPEENDYEFSKSIIFEDDREKGKGNLVLKLLGALAAGGISGSALGRLISAAGTGGRIYSHYMAFPENPALFEAWTRKADLLWKKAGSMADLAEEDLAGMERAENS
jgi:flavin-dependent dehydrogenase